MLDTAGEVSDILLWTPLNGLTSFAPPAKMYMHQFSVNTAGHIEDSLRTMANRDG